MDENRWINPELDSAADASQTLTCRCRLDMAANQTVDEAVTAACQSRLIGQAMGQTARTPPQQVRSRESTMLLCFIG